MSGIKYESKRRRGQTGYGKPSGGGKGVVANPWALEL